MVGLVTRVELSQIMLGTEYDVFGGQHAHEDTVVLIIILKRAVSPDEAQSLDRIQEPFDLPQMVFVAAAVDRITALDPMDQTDLNRRSIHEPGGHEFMRGQCDQLLIGIQPQGIVILTPIFKREDRRFLLCIELGHPVPEIGDTTDVQVWRVHVDPVVGGEIGGTDIEINENRIAKRQLGRRRPAVCWYVIELIDQEGQGHGRDDLSIRGVPPIAELEPGHSTVLREYALDRLSKVDRTSEFPHAGGHRFIHAAGPFPRIRKLIDERLMGGCLGKGMLDCLAQGELLNPLGREIGVEFLTTNPPQLLTI